MKNKDKWVSSKYIYKNKRLTSSKDPKEVSISSRLMTNIIASYYEYYIPKYAKGKLIDLGCGKVPLYEIYKSFVTDNICIDWPNTLHKNMFLDYEYDITKDLPFENETFDTIILSDVLEHVAQPKSLFKEMNRILNYSGILLMNVPFFYWLHEEPHDYYRYTEYALNNLAEMAGFEILHMKPIGGVIEIIGDIISKNVIQIPLIGRITAITIQHIVRHIRNTKYGTKISQVTGKKFPLGYFMVAKKTNKRPSIN